MSDLDLTSVQRSMHERMENVSLRATWVADQVASGTLDPAFQHGWQNAMRALAASHMDVMAYGLITGDRQFIGYNPEGMRDIRRTLPADDMLISELAHLRGPSTNHTSFPRWDPYFKQTAIANWIPLFLNGRYLGTFIQYLSLSNLSHSLIQGREGLPGVPFVLIGGNRVNAHPILNEWGDHTASRSCGWVEILRATPIPPSEP